MFSFNNPGSGGVFPCNSDGWRWYCLTQQRLLSLSSICKKSRRKTISLQPSSLRSSVPCQIHLCHTVTAPLPLSRGCCQQCQAAQQVNKCWEEEWGLSEIDLGRVRVMQSGAGQRMCSSRRRGADAERHFMRVRCPQARH